MKTERYTTEIALDFPWPHMQPGVIYHLVERGWVQFLCPCGCGEPITVPVAVHGPSWRPWDLKVEPDGSITLSPSIQFDLQRCGSHFFLREGKVQWC